MSIELGSAVGYLDLDYSKFVAGLRVANNELNNQTDSMVNNISSKFKSVGSSLTLTGSSLMQTFTRPIIGIGKNIINATSNFESTMSKVKAISGATGNDLKQLSNKAKEMGATTKFSAKEAADGLTYMAMAGWQTQDMLDGLEGIMNLAAADGLDLATTSDIVTDALTAFGLTAKDSAHFADVLAVSASATNTSVSMLGESFKYVAPVAGALKYSAEDVAIALGIMANSGIKAGQAGTTLRSALTDMINPTKQAQKMMDEYGISITNTDGTMKPLLEVMQMLREKMGGLSESEQAMAASTIFGQRAMSGMLAIINASEGDFNNLITQMNNVDGAAKNMAETMMDNFSGQITILKSSLEGLAIQFGEILLPQLSNFVSKVQDLVKWFSDLENSQKEQIIKWLEIVAIIGPVLLILGKFSLAIGSIIKLFTGLFGVFKSFTLVFVHLGEAIKLGSSGFTALASETSLIYKVFAGIKAVIVGLTGPIIAIIAVIVTLALTFKYLFDTNEEFRNKIVSIWNNIKSMFEATFEQIKEQIQKLIEALSKVGTDIWNSLKPVFDKIANTLAPIFIGVFTQIQSVIKLFLSVFGNLIQVIVSILTGDFNSALEGLKNIWDSVWNYLKESINNAINTIIEFLTNGLFVWFGTTWNELWNSIKETFLNLWTSIKEGFIKIVNNISTWINNFINSTIEFFANLPYNVGYALGSIIATIIQWGVTMVENAIRIGGEFVNNYINFITQLPANTVTLFNMIITNVIAWGVQMVNNIILYGSLFISSAISFISQLPTTIQQYLTSAIENIVKWGTDLLNKGKESISQLISGISTKAEEIPNKMMEIGQNIVDGVWNGIQNAKNAFMEQVGNFFSGIVDGAKEALNINSPSKEMEDEVGIWILPGMLKGIEKTKDKVFNTIGGLLNNSIQNLNIQEIDGGNLLSSFINEVVLSLTTMEEKLINIIGLFNYLVNTYGEITLGIGNVFNAYNKENKTDKWDESKQGNNYQGGDTFIFNSPKPIDEIEAARQLKKTKQELAEGF